MKLAQNFDKDISGKNTLYDEENSKKYLGNWVMFYMYWDCSNLKDWLTYR